MRLAVTDADPTGAHLSSAAAAAAAADAAAAAADDAAAAADAAIEALVHEALPLVGHLVRETASRVPAHVNRDDLTSAAMYALATSAKAFDPTNGTPFVRYAAIRIRGALTDELRSMDWAGRGLRSRARELDTVREMLAQALDRTPTHADIAHALGVSVREVASIESDVHRANVVSLHAVTAEDDVALPAATAEQPDTLLVRRENIGYLRDALAELPPRLRHIVEQYFFEHRKMADIAAELGVTESRVSQLRTQALTLLRAALRAADDADGASSAAGPARGRAVRDYCAAVTARSTLSSRLTATTVLGESRPLPSQLPSHLQAAC